MFLRSPPGPAYTPCDSGLGGRGTRSRHNPPLKDASQRSTKVTFSCCDIEAPLGKPTHTRRRSTRRRPPNLSVTGACSLVRSGSGVQCAKRKTIIVPPNTLSSAIKCYLPIQGGISVHGTVSIVRDRHRAARQVVKDDVQRSARVERYTVRRERQAPTRGSVDACGPSVRRTLCPYVFYRRTRGR